MAGFPDMATRAFVWQLYGTLGLPVLGLCDWNPFGIAILLTYKLGSRERSEEGSQFGA